MAVKKKVMLVCSECNSRNYSKNKSNSDRLILKKHCKKCMKHTEHKEDK